MSYVYIERLHGVDYTNLTAPVPAEANGESPPPRAAPAGHPWKPSNRLFGRTGLPGAALIHGVFAQGPWCRSTRADAAHDACARAVDRPRSRVTPRARARGARG